METISEFFAMYWIYLTVAGSLALFIVPWLFVWRYRRRRNWLKENGRSAQAKILKLWNTGLVIGSSGGEHGDMRGIGLLLEIHPQDGQPYQIKTRDQLHLVDISRIASHIPGMIVKVRIDPNKPQRVVVNWEGE